MPGEVSAGITPDPANRTQIQVDVVVLAPGLPGERREILSLGEAKWGKVMGIRHLERLRRARNLLAARGYETTGTVPACYGGSGFDKDLRAVADREGTRLAGLAALHAG